MTGRCINEVSVTFNTHIFMMATACYNPSQVAAIPYVWFFTSALNIIKQYRTTSSTEVSFLPCRVRSNETQLTAGNVTLSLTPQIITDSTPAKTGMIYFDSSRVVLWSCRIYQPDLCFWKVITKERKSNSRWQKLFSAVFRKHKTSSV